MEGDTEPLRNSAAQWTLAGDKHLLGVLQNIHERLVSRCQETNRRLGEMAAALDDAALDLHNVNNKFMALSNTQFIESRVYDDDVEITAPPDTAKEPKMAADATSEIEKIKLGVKVLESMHEPLHILHDTDSESDTDDDGVTRMVLKLKDPYAHRPLPYIIGSYAWQNKWHAGLVPEDSDSDSSVCRSKHDSREEYSDSGPESAGDAQTDKLPPGGTVSSDSSDLASELEPSPADRPSDIAAELARRLGGHTDKTLQPEMEYSPPNPSNKKVYRPEKPATSTIFSDEPPPLEHSYSDRDEYSQEEDDDIFAELNKNKPYTQNNRVQNQVTEDLFGGLGKSDGNKDGDIFSDFKEPSKPANQKSTLFSEESEPELFAEKPPPKATKHDVPQETVKKPVGGISLFGNKGTESIGAAILKRNQRQSSTDEDTVSEETPTHKQVTKKEKDIFDDLFAKSEKEQRDAKKNVTVAKEVETEVKKDKKVDLFSDNIFDDIDDIFTSNIPKVPIKDASKNQKSIFDDEDDLFSDVAVSKNIKPEVKANSNIQKSIFDSDDELFTERTVPKSTDCKKTIIKPVTEVTVSKTIKSVFDDSSDSDIFSEIKKPVSMKNNPMDKPKISKKDLVKSKGNVQEVAKIIRDNTTNENAIASGEKVLTKAEISKRSGPVDENDDIFKTNLSTNMQQSKPLDTVVEEVPTTGTFQNNEQNKTDVSNKIKAKTIFDEELQDDLFNDSSTRNTKQLEEAKVTKSTFDNDSGEELFSNKSKTKNNSEIMPHRPETKVINHEGSNVFGNINTPLQNTINITGDALSTKTENAILKEGYDNFTNPERNKQETSKNDVSNIINEEEIDDLFTKSKNVETLTEIRKEETDSIVNKGNSNDWEDDLFKDNTIQEITQTDANPTAVNIKPIFDKNSLEKDLFTNICNNNNQKEINELKIEAALDKTSKIQESKRLIAEEVEPEITNDMPDITNDNILNASQDTLFYDKANIDIEIPPLCTEQNESSFNKSDIFSDIFSEPPEFEKPKEPKKSKNVNALFDDDSDDEALFFKKNDPTLDDKPDYSLPAAENRLFGLFHDEPPALDVDFVQKSSKTPNLYDVPKDQVDFNNDFAKTETVFAEKSPQTPGSPKSENELFLESKAEIPVAKRVSDKPNVQESESNKRVGKLKSMNFSINVNALLPGASPKKVKAVEHTKEPMHASSEADIRTKDSSIQELEPKLVKSISFEEKPESRVLDNTLSKERVKIQVKRRPSTRRARKEAARKSAIDFGDDSTDHSSSIDDGPKTDNSEIDLKPAIDSEHVYSSLNYDSILDIDDLKSDTVPISSNTSESPKSETEPKVSEVKTKTVYILNDEDIFDIEPKSNTKKTSNIVDDHLFKGNLEHTETADISKLDINEGLIKATKKDLEPENVTKKCNDDDEETLFNDTKSKKLNIVDDGDDLFKLINNSGVNTLGKVYKESKSSDVEDESLFKTQHRDNEQTTRDNLAVDLVTDTENRNETTSTVGDRVKKQIEKELKYETESIDRTNNSIDKPKEVKKASIFNLSDEENELFNKNTRSVKKSVFDSDSDDELFNKKGPTVKKEAKDVKETKVKAKVDVKASLFGDDDDDELFGVKIKKSDDVAPQLPRTTAREVASRTTEPAFEDPLSLLGAGEDYTYN